MVANMMLTAGSLLDRNYRYLVLAASVLMLTIGWGGVAILSVALKPMAESMDWPRSVPSLAYALHFIGAGVGGILMGLLMDRRGMAKPALIGALSVAAAALLTSRVEGPWDIYLSYGVLMGVFGQGALFAPLSANVTHWFSDRPGMAIGIVSSGQSLAGAVWPPVLRYLIDGWGWRATFLYYGVFALVTMLLLSVIFRRRPPVRAVASRDSRGGYSLEKGQRASVGLSANRLQAILSCAFVGCCIAMAIPLGHIVAHASDLGFSAARGAELLSVILAASFISRVYLLGAIADRFGGLVALVVFSGGQFVGITAFAFIEGLAGLYVLAAVFGLAYGGVSPCYAVIVRQYLPVSQVGRRIAALMLFGTLGMAIGSWLGGYVFDLTGVYRSAFLIGGGANFANLLVVGGLILRERRARLAIERAPPGELSPPG